jgi:ABC-type sugar transport system permease subunit
MNNSQTQLSKMAYMINLGLLGLFVAAMLWLITVLLADGLYPIVSALSAITVFVILIYARRSFTPYRWLGLGIALALLFTVYPILYTFYLSVTNMGSGHLMSKEQAIERLESELYLPEDGLSYQWAGYAAPDGTYGLWLIAEDGSTYLAKPNQALEPMTASGEVDDRGFPLVLEGYERLAMNQVAPKITEISLIDFGVAPNTVRVSSLREAGGLKPKYQYDAAQDIITDLETGTIYRPIEGTFTSEAGDELPIGFITYIGFEHFVNFLGNEGFRQPLILMLGWNISFAFMSVFLSFVVGLIVTLLFDDLPGKRIIRALLIIPWPIPVLISILIWRSMLDPDLGFVSAMLESIFGWSPSWFQDAGWTRLGVIMVNVWLSYPYFYVITAGAIRSIPSEIYDAAVVDGASHWSKFYHITLPLLLKILFPLLIASFTFNFNNFNVIYIFNFGNPPMANTIIPMGHTDILISFVYQLAFVTSNVTNYGLAAAITVMLFLLVALMVVVQARFTNLFKEAE